MDRWIGILVAVALLALLTWAGATAARGHRRSEPFAPVAVALLVGMPLAVWLALDDGISSRAIQEFLQVGIQVMVTLVIAIGIEHLAIGVRLAVDDQAAIALSVTTVLVAIAFCTLALIPGLPGGGAFETVALILTPSGIVAGLFTFLLFLIAGTELLEKKTDQ